MHEKKMYANFSMSIIKVLNVWKKIKAELLICPVLVKFLVLLDLQ